MNVCLTHVLPLQGSALSLNRHLCPDTMELDLNIQVDSENPRTHLPFPRVLLKTMESQEALVSAHSCWLGNVNMDPLAALFMLCYPQWALGGLPRGFKAVLDCNNESYEASAIKARAGLYEKLLISISILHKTVLR